MKIFRVFVLLGITTGVISFQTRLLPIFAAVSPSAGTTQASDTDSASSPGAKVFLNNCAMCHGAKMEGHPPVFPTLAGVGKKMNSDQITQLVRQGRGQMPGFPAAKLSDADLASLLQYLTTNPTFMPSGTPAQAAPASPPPVAMNPGPRTPTGPGASTYLQNCAFC